MLTKFFNDQGLLKKKYQKFVFTALLLYCGMITLMCFTPQKPISGISTPNIIYWGRLRLLLVPFNSLVSLSELNNIWKLLWVFGQNVLNIFLLFPLGLCIHLLWDKWESSKKALLLGFYLSLFIECMQLVLDLCFDFNRVFEIDDLWTNSLGVLLAYWVVRLMKNKRLLSKRLSE